MEYTLYFDFRKVTVSDDDPCCTCDASALLLFNPDDKEHVVYWTLDGKPVERADNGYWTAEVGGVLKAEIAYKDGSRDAVAKELTVK